MVSLPRSEQRSPDARPSSSRSGSTPFTSARVCRFEATPKEGGYPGGPIGNAEAGPRNLRRPVDPVALVDNRAAEPSRLSSTRIMVSAIRDRILDSYLLAGDHQEAGESRSRLLDGDPSRRPTASSASTSGYSTFREAGAPDALEESAVEIRRPDSERAADRETWTRDRRGGHGRARRSPSASRGRLISLAGPEATSISRGIEELEASRSSTRSESIGARGRRALPDRTRNPSNRPDIGRLGRGRVRKIEEASTTAAQAAPWPGGARRDRCRTRAYRRGGRPWTISTSRIANATHGDRRNGISRGPQPPSIGCGRSLQAAQARIDSLGAEGGPRRVRGAVHALLPRRLLGAASRSRRLPRRRCEDQLSRQCWCDSRSSIARFSEIRAEFARANSLSKREEVYEAFERARRQDSPRRAPTAEPAELLMTRLPSAFSNGISRRRRAPCSSPDEQLNTFFATDRHGHEAALSWRSSLREISDDAVKADEP